MKSNRAVGIAGYGAAIPRFRLSTQEIAAVWRPSGSAAASIAEKSVPGPDEDTTTLAIEAARLAFRRSELGMEKLGAIWVGTESAPYAAKTCASLVAAALGAPRRLLAADLEFACKGGSEAMQVAVAAVGAGMVHAAIAIGADVAQSRPGDVLENTAGCAGAAFVLAPGEESLATIEGSVSYVSNTPDFFRRAGAAYPQHAGRFTEEPGYYHHTRSASVMLLEELGAKPADFSYAVFHQPVPKLVERVAADLGFSKSQLEAGFCVSKIGNAYAGSSLLGLAAILDQAKPGERIFYCSYGSGAGSDAFAFTVTDRILNRRGRPTVAEYLSRRVELPGYGHYLRLTGSIRM